MKPINLGQRLPLNELHKGNKFEEADALAKEIYEKVRSEVKIIEEKIENNEFFEDRSSPWLGKPRIALWHSIVDLHDKPTENNYGHGNKHAPGYGPEMYIRSLIRILKGERFQGMFGKMYEEKEETVGLDTHTSLDSPFIITINDMSENKIHNKDGSLNLENNVEVLCNDIDTPAGRELAKIFPHIVFRDYLGNKL